MDVAIVRGFGRADFGGVLAVWDCVECGEAYADAEAWGFGADAVDDATEEAGAGFERTAECAGAIDGGEEFVSEVAVTVFDVDEGVARGFGDACGLDEVVDQA